MATEKELAEWRAKAVADQAAAVAAGFAALADERRAEAARIVAAELDAFDRGFATVDAHVRAKTKAADGAVRAEQAAARARTAARALAEAQRVASDADDEAELADLEAQELAALAEGA